MFCIGEKKEERETGVTMEVCAKQLEPLAKALDAKQWDSVAIAYEPVWVSPINPSTNQQRHWHHTEAAVKLSFVSRRLN